MEQKLDKIIEALEKKATAAAGTATQPETQEEKDEKRVKELDQEIDEIISLMHSKDTRESIKDKIRQSMQAIAFHKKESHPYLKVFHTIKKSGKTVIMQKRTTHMLELAQAYEQQHALHKYPHDLNHILNVKIAEKNDLLAKRSQKYI